MADRQAHYQVQRARIQRQSRNAKRLVGVGGALGAMGAAVAIVGKPPYSRDPNVQKYVGLQSRADSLRSNLESFREDGQAIHPILRTVVDKNTAAEMRTELGGIENQMIDMGIVPGLAEYQNGSQIQTQTSTGLVLISLAAVLAGGYKARSTAMARANLDKQMGFDKIVDKARKNTGDYK